MNPGGSAPKPVVGAAGDACAVVGGERARGGSGGRGTTTHKTSWGHRQSALDEVRARASDTVTEGAVDDDAGAGVEADLEELSGPMMLDGGISASGGGGGGVAAGGDGGGGVSTCSSPLACCHGPAAMMA